MKEFVSFYLVEVMT